ncbi:unnamed protein product [Tilletia controversa]|uniref:Uncharacterized protein n=1 Tax=Tilletia caries TaxID=13290 RepID=A0A177UHL8_9BASI|nr:hypothetical protein A4X03_0g2058 [Tilletia caries]CAD6963439.1 unnamed protein product [Tilletia controversa]CAD7061573.1 unnamed protein product [Tilletia caries]
MVVRLRLARHGTRNNPFYHIVAIHNKKRRNALPIEKLGEYDPIPRWRPVPAPTSAAGPSSAVAARASQSSSSSSSSLSKVAPSGSAAVANTPPPRSIAQAADLLAQERAQAAAGGGLTSASSKAELAQHPRPGYGLLMTSGLASELRLEKRIEWNEERIRYWIKVGAQPSKPVAKLLNKAGLIPEGKWFKGMPPRPEDKAPESAGPSTSSSSSAS